METIAHVFQQRQHMLREDYEIYHYKDSRELHVSLHFHDFYECYLLLFGNIRYQIESVSFTVLPGDLLLIGPNQLHRPVFTHSNEPYERIVLWLSRSFVERLSSEQTDLSACFSARRAGATRLSSEQHTRLTRLLFRLLDATNANQFGRDVLCRSLAAELLVSLNLVSGAEQSLPTGDVQESALVQAVSRYLDANIGQPVSLNDLSAAVFLSKYYLERAFKRETGVSIYQMLLQKRMIRARNLMRSGHSLQAVAQQCGFSEYSAFYKAFRHEYGVSPRNYLAQLG